MLPSIGRVFIRVYRLAIDARPKRGDGGADRKYPSMLEDFQTSTKSMARKRHLASIARGFLCFCLMAHHRSTLMRTHPAAYCPPGSIYNMLSIPRALPPVTHSSALQAPECLRFVFLPRIRRIERIHVLRRS